MLKNYMIPVLKRITFGNAEAMNEHDYIISLLLRKKDLNCIREFTIIVFFKFFIRINGRVSKIF